MSLAPHLNNHSCCSAATSTPTLPQPAPAAPTLAQGSPRVTKPAFEFAIHSTASPASPAALPGTCAQPDNSATAAAAPVDAASVTPEATPRVVQRASQPLDDPSSIDTEHLLEDSSEDFGAFGTPLTSAASSHTAAARAAAAGGTPVTPARAAQLLVSAFGSPHVTAPTAVADGSGAFGSPDVIAPAPDAAPPQRSSGSREQSRANSGWEGEASAAMDERVFAPYMASAATAANSCEAVAPVATADTSLAPPPLQLEPRVAGQRHSLHGGTPSGEAPPHLDAAAAHADPPAHPGAWPHDDDDATDVPGAVINERTARPEELPVDNAAAQGNELSVFPLVDDDAARPEGLPDDDDDMHAADVPSMNDDAAQPLAITENDGVNAPGTDGIAAAATDAGLAVQFSFDDSELDSPGETALQVLAVQAPGEAAQADADVDVAQTLETQPRWTVPAQQASQVTPGRRTTQPRKAALADSAAESVAATPRRTTRRSAAADASASDAQAASASAATPERRTSRRRSGAARGQGSGAGGASNNTPRRFLRSNSAAALTTPPVVHAQSVDAQHDQENADVLHEHTDADDGSDAYSMPPLAFKCGKRSKSVAGEIAATPNRELRALLQERATADVMLSPVRSHCWLVPALGPQEIWRCVFHACLCTALAIAELDVLSACHPVGVTFDAFYTRLCCMRRASMLL